MSNKTTTEWNCQNCNKLDYKPAWLAKARQFCSRKCTAEYRLKQDPDYFFNKGALADPKKIRDTLKAKGITPPSRLGTKHTEQYKTNRSLQIKEQWATGKRVACKNPKISADGLARKIAATQKMRKLLAKGGKLTDIEKIIDNYLHKNKIKHEHEYAVGRKVVDFYLPELKLFLEADGAYWHDSDKDAVRDLYISRIRPEIKIIRCTEKTIKNGSWIDLIPWGAKRGV